MNLNPAIKDRIEEIHKDEIVFFISDSLSILNWLFRVDKELMGDKTFENCAGRMLMKIVKFQWRASTK